MKTGRYIQGAAAQPGSVGCGGRGLPCVCYCCQECRGPSLPGPSSQPTGPVGRNDRVDLGGTKAQTPPRHLPRCGAGKTYCWFKKRTFSFAPFFRLNMARNRTRRWCIAKWQIFIDESNGNLKDRGFNGAIMVNVASRITTWSLMTTSTRQV